MLKIKSKLNPQIIWQWSVVLKTEWENTNVISKVIILWYRFVNYESWFKLVVYQKVDREWLWIWCDDIKEVQSFFLFVG